MEATDDAPAGAANAVDAVELDADAAAVRSRLSKDRAELVDRLRSLRGQFDDIVSAATGVSTDDEHDPEGATIAFERAQVSALVHQAEARLIEVDAASRRLDDRTYGICQRCGTAIGDERLAARPSATTCIACAGLR